MTTAVLWGVDGELISVGWGEPAWPGDSGLTVLLSDSPDPDDVDIDDPRIGIVHLDCLLDDFPGLEDGIAVAEEWCGAADLGDGGEWIGRAVG